MYLNLEGKETWSFEMIDRCTKSKFAIDKIVNFLLTALISGAI